MTLTTSSGLAQIPVAGSGLLNLVLNGISGDDTFDVTAPQTYNSIALNGGPSDPSVANLIANSTTTAVTLGDPMTTVNGGGLGAVTLSGVGVINLMAPSASGNILNVSVTGTAGQPDNIAVTPTAPGADPGQRLGPAW